MLGATPFDSIRFCHRTAGGGGVRLRVESQGQRVGLLGTRAGQRPSASFSSRNPFSERASPKELGNGQRVPTPLAGESKQPRRYNMDGCIHLLRTLRFMHDFHYKAGPVYCTRNLESSVLLYLPFVFGRLFVHAKIRRAPNAH